MPKTTLQGHLQLTVLSAKITLKTKFGILKPYVVIKLGDKETKTPKALGNRPQWNFSTELERSHQTMLHFRVVSKKILSKSLVGEGTLAITSLVYFRVEKFSVCLHKKKKQTGELAGHLELVPESLISPTQQIAEGKIELENISFTKKLYESQSGKQEVYVAYLVPSKLQVAVKVNHCQNLDEFNRVQREALAMFQLSHPNVCKIYASLLDCRKERLDNLLVMEKCEGLDLGQEISKRAKLGFFWEETQLWNYFLQLIDVFQEMQLKNIVHSDIKPQNLMLGPSSTIKVIDFGISLQGYSEFFKSSAGFRLGGTLPYFSPLQLQGYLKFLKGNNPSGTVHHNPFKSDVFSLGLTFLHMASLELPESLNKYPSRVAPAIASLGYSDKVKWLLSWMLEFKEPSRPDFLELAKSLQGVSNFECKY